MKILWIDTETTGVNPDVNALIQIAGIIVDGEVKEEFNLKAKPFPDDQIDFGAIEATGLDMLEVIKYETPAQMMARLLIIFNKYIDPYKKDKTSADKFIAAGYNVRFDLEFLDAFFRKNNNVYLRSYIDKITIDVMSLAHYLAGFELIEPRSFKLVDVCEESYIKIEGAHDALADVKATRKLSEVLNDKFINLLCSDGPLKSDLPGPTQEMLDISPVDGRGYKKEN